MTNATEQPDIDDTTAGTDRFAAQLKQDVRSWSARDNAAPDRHAEAALELGTKSRPFSMSYEGVSNEQYLAGRIARGAR
jgi:hypothetical protein